MICLLVSLLGIVSAFSLDTNQIDNGTNDTSDDIIHRWTWRGKSFENPVRVDVSEYQNIPDLGVNHTWQVVVNDAINDINNMSNNANLRADFAFENNFREAEVTMAARSLPATVDENGTLISNAPLAWANPYENNGLVEVHRENNITIYVIQKAEVVINTDLINTDHPWGIPGRRNAAYDLESTIVHELGHVAGLGHHTGTNSAMRTPLAYVGEWRRWGTDDVNGLIAIYGVRQEERPEENISTRISARLNDIRESTVTTDSIVIRENVAGEERITIEETTRKTTTLEYVNKLYHWWSNLW